MEKDTSNHPLGTLNAVVYGINFYAADTGDETLKAAAEKIVSEVGVSFSSNRVLGELDQVLSDGELPPDTAEMLTNFTPAEMLEILSRFRSKLQAAMDSE